jgi:hypothetical protein
MKKLFIFVGVVAAGIALADVTITRTWTSAGSTVDEMKFTSLPDGGFTATVCGHSTFTTGGGVTPGNCAPPLELGNTGVQGTMKTDLSNLRLNRALPHWKANNPDAPGL